MQKYHHLRFLGSRDKYLIRVGWAKYELLRTRIVFWASWIRSYGVDYRSTDNPIPRGDIWDSKPAPAVCNIYKLQEKKTEGGKQSESQVHYRPSIR